jgi:hypothetical protein
MKSPIGPILAVAMLAIASTAGMPTRILAQQNNRNETGLPLYPHTTTGSQYPAASGFLIYTAQTSDTLPVVEAWYRQALPKATEAKDENQLTHGIVLTSGKDRVLVYQLGNRKGAVLELQKYVGGN